MTKSISVLHFMRDYPQKNPYFFKGNDYEVLGEVEIAYFAASCGRLYCIAKSEQDIVYSVSSHTFDFRPVYD